MSGSGGVTRVESLREDLRALISRQGLKPGDRFTSEPELVDLFGVSRSTIREALKRLEEEGILVARRGEGRFVSASGSVGVERPMTKYESITEVLEARGFEVSTAVLGVVESTAGPEEAAALDIQEGADVIRVTRIRYGDGEPLVVGMNTIVRDALPGPIDHRDWSGSLTAMLAAHGHHVVSAIATVSAVHLPDDVVRRHALPGDEPWLLVSETAITRTGRRVMLANDHHRGDQITFSVVRRR